MSKRIEYLWESPCSQCGCDYECEMKIAKSPNIGVIKDKMFGDAEADYHECGIWIALNVKDIGDEDEVPKW